LRKQHYGVLAAVIAGFLLCRLLSIHVVDGIGSLAGHRRAADAVIGVVFAGVPFVVLTVYAALLLRGDDVEGRVVLKAVAALGWFVAGGVLGILPYSRFGTETRLLTRERLVAPGFLHAMDVTIGVDLVVTVVLLLVSLRSNLRQRAGGPAD
jgi:hypothetical protein